MCSHVCSCTPYPHDLPKSSCPYIGTFRTPSHVFTLALHNYMYILTHLPHIHRHVYILMSIVTHVFMYSSHTHTFTRIPSQLPPFSYALTHPLYTLACLSNTHTHVSTCLSPFSCTHISTHLSMTDISIPTTSHRTPSPHSLAHSVPSSFNTCHSWGSVLFWLTLKVKCSTLLMLLLHPCPHHPDPQISRAHSFVCSDPMALCSLTLTKSLASSNPTINLKPVHVGILARYSCIISGSRI